MKSGLKLFSCAATAASVFLIQTEVRAQLGGVPLWTRVFGPSAPVPKALAIDTSGNVFVTGTGGTVKCSGGGIGLWTNLFSAPDYIATGIAVDANGNALVTFRSFDKGCATLKYSGAGVPLWTNHLGAYEIPSIAVDNNSGKVFVAGTTSDPYITTTGDYVTVAYSGAGLPLWTNNYHGSANDNTGIRDIAVDGNGDVFVTGRSAGSFVTIKYSGAGAPLWTNRYGMLNATADAVAVDGSGNAFVTGSSGYISTTIKYSGAGVALWTNLFDKGGSSGRGQSLAIDSSGNLCVAASALDSTTGSNDFLTLKYSGAGLPLWTNRFNTTQKLSHSVCAIAVDAGGNVFVYGDASYDDGGTSWTVRFTTVAYSSGGVPLWAKSYTENTSLGSAADMAVDGKGNVFVTGFSVVGDILTKYSSALTLLTINRTASNTVVFSWPAAWTDITLQENTDVKNASNWSNVAAGVQDDGTTKRLVADPASGNRFYRLNKRQ